MRETLASSHLGKIAPDPTGNCGGRSMSCPTARPSSAGSHDKALTPVGGLPQLGLGIASGEDRPVAGGLDVEWSGPAELTCSEREPKVAGFSVCKREAPHATDVTSMWIYLNLI